MCLAELLQCGAGETRQELEASPFGEQLLEKGYEVIYFTDPVDEYVMQNLLEYEDLKFQSASKEDLKLGDKDAKKENKKLRVGLLLLYALLYLHLQRKGISSKLRIDAQEG